MTFTPFDATALARVLVMPGAAELFDAFSRIPPGSLRQSVIDHAQVIAQTYTDAPDEMRMPDPLITAAKLSERTAPVIAEPEKPRLPKALAGHEAQVIEARKAGVPVAVIAREAHIATGEVSKIIAAARRAGISFPNLRLATGRPLDKKTWITDFNLLSGQGTSTVQRAARARGMSPQQYLQAKQEAVDMAVAGHGYKAIIAKLRVDRKTISLWLSNARAAGFSIPYAARDNVAEQFGETEPAASNVVRPTRFFGPWSAAQHSRTKIFIERAAVRRNMTPEAYMDLQESIVRHRMSGIGGNEIAVLTGQNHHFIKDVLATAKQRGANYPPLKKAS